MNTQNHGFDAVYQVDQDSVLAALENMAVDAIKIPLAEVDFAVPLPAPVPANTVQHGTLRMVSQPISTLMMPGTGDDAILTVKFPATLLALDPVAPAGVFAGIKALAPTAAGPLTLTFTLRLSATPATSQANLTIQHGMPLEVSDVGDMTTPFPNLSPLTPLLNVGPLVQTAIGDAVTNVLAPIFPLRFPIPFGELGVCGIGPRRLDVKFLGGPRPALGFFLQLLPDTSGAISMATESDLTRPGGAIILSNHFLKQLVCCLFRQVPFITGLPEPTETHEEEDGEERDCCRWRNVSNVRIESERVKVNELDICVVRNAGAQSTIHLHLKASQSGTGWTAYARLDVDLQLLRDGNALGVMQLDPDAETWTDISPWVWIIVGLAAALGALAGFVIGFVAGGPAAGGALAWKGGVIGAAIGFALVGVTAFVLKAIGSLAANAISGALSTLDAAQTGILPPEITRLFGTIGDVVEVDFDDLFVAGTIRPPRRDNVLHEGIDVILDLGDSIDLDRGVIRRAGSAVAGFVREGDIEWRREDLVAIATRTVGGDVEGPGSIRRPETAVTVMARVFSGHAGVFGAFGRGVLAPLSTARTVPLASASFWSLTEGALGAVAFPQTRGNAIAGDNIVRSETPHPPAGRVVAVRTTAGRLAKLLAWRDSYERLHLSYVTYKTEVPLSIEGEWTVTRGPVVDITPVGTVRQVSRAALLTARGRITESSWWSIGLAPIYRWLFDDQPLVGTGVLPDGTISFVTQQGTLRLHTAMGKRLRGVLQLEVERFGKVFAATLDLDEPGTIHEGVIVDAVLAMNGPPPPPPQDPELAPPIHEQLPAAFSRAMGIPPERVRFH